MSHLRVFRPDWCMPDGFHEQAGDVDVIPFERFSGRDEPLAPANTLERARLIYRNRFCPRCGRPVVEPLDLEDGLRNRNGMTIPGTSTLVGFFCRGCDTEWAV